MGNEPFELRSIKREIENARKSSIPIGLTKITIHTSDAIWMVRNVESFLKIADSWKERNQKDKINQFKIDYGRLIDLKV